MPIGPQKMPFLSHLAELRTRLLIIIVTLMVGAMITYPFTQAIVNWLFEPIALYLTDHALNFFGPFEAFGFRFKVATYAAVVFTSPIWLYQVLAFFLPALKEHERKWFVPTLFSIIALFIAGNLFCHYFVIAPSFQWLLAQSGGGIDPSKLLYQWFHIGHPAAAGFSIKLQTLAGADKFLGGLAILMLAFGITFELPVLMFFLMGAGVIKYHVFRKNWRYVYLGLVSFASLATPDWSPVTIGILFVAVTVLYEVTMLLARFAFRERIAQQIAAEQTAA